MDNKTAKIGELFKKRKLITEQQLEVALQQQAHTGEFLGEILVRLGFVTEVDLLRVLAEQFQTQVVALDRIPINAKVLKMIPRTFAWEYRIMPIDINASTLLIAVSNPLDVWPVSELQDRFNLAEVRTVLARKEDIMAAIRKHYGSETSII